MDSKPIPLLPPEVLEHLLAFLPVASLRSCRLVNSSWAKAAIVPMRKKSGSTTFHLASGTQDLKRFVTCSHASDGNSPVVSRFEVIMAPFDRLSEVGEKHLDQFFRTVSPIVTELTLAFNWERNQENWPGNHDYPKLTSLALKVNSYPCSGNYPLSLIPQESPFDFVQRIILRAPKLNTVSFQFAYHGNGGAVGPCIEAISKHPVLLERLNHLHLRYMKKDSDFPKLNSLHSLKLKKLQLDNGPVFFWGPDRYGDTFKFLESQADSLEILEIGRFWGYEHDILKIPALRKLKQLKITDAKKFEPLLSSAFFEVLKRVHLHLGRFNLNATLSLFFQPFPFDSVEELIVEGWVNVESNASMLRAATVFPNISKLEISSVTSRTAVKAVYSSFSNLVELSLTTSNGFGFMDQVITGLSWRELRALEMEVNATATTNQRDDACCLSRKLSSVKSKSIASLQQLQTLRLRTTVWDLPIEFGHVSCFVLKSMKSLKCLDLGVRSFPETDERTQAVLQDLREKLIVIYDDPPLT